MTPSSTDRLLDQLMSSHRTDRRPWGVMCWLDAPSFDLTVKHLTVRAGERTSLQYHKAKDELLVILGGDGWVEVETYRCSEGMVRIKPHKVHRVVGPLSYLEVSTYDDDTDTCRLADDHGRA